MTVFAMNCGELGAGARAGRPKASQVHPALGVGAAVGRKAVDEALVDHQKLSRVGMIGEQRRRCRHEQYNA